MASMALQRLALGADRNFWTKAAAAVLELARAHGLPARRLQAMTWIVPAAGHAVSARLALRAALGHAAFVPPRIATLPQWLGVPLAASVAARAELFTALRANGWVRAAFGARPEALWALARAVVQLCDELTLAAGDDEDAFAGRLQASLARHFDRRAARVLEPQAKLVLQLWRARGAAADGAAAALRALAARAAQADGPLVYVAERALAGWEDGFLRRYARRAPVLAIEAQVAPPVAAQPTLAAAWPELAGGDCSVPIAVRAERARGAPPPPLAIVAADSLEEEAAAVAQQVLEWLSAGCSSIALVALDRLTARRVRALLERAQVTLRDETGWKLSTTSAAAAVMGWLQLVAGDLYWRDLLDWVKSSFTLADRPDKEAVAEALERAIREAGALQGARALRRALGDGGGGAHEVLAAIETQAAAARRAMTFAAHARALQAALAALGMREALAADAAGSLVLRELDLLEADLGGISGQATPAEFRALLAERFEEIGFVERQVESPVALLPLAATSLRTFDAAILIGADAQHLPAAGGETLFLSNAVRADLGLATGDSERRAQSEQFAALVADTPRVIATWRRRSGDEPNALSPLLERLQFVCQRAAGQTLQLSASRATFTVAASAPARPAPRAPQRLPDRISASDAQSLVTCPYQFYSRRLLGLARLEDVAELPDKRDAGQALHEVLRRFHAAWGATDFSRCDADALAESLAAHAREVFAPLLERTPALAAFAHRFHGLIPGYVGWLRAHAAAGWRFRAAEQFHKRSLTLRDGRAIELVGRVDRIDAQSDGRIKVIDYKLRRAEQLKRALAEAGEDIQLPVYALLLDAGEGTEAAYLSFERARDDDDGVCEVAPAHPLAGLAQAVGARLHADLQRIADGAPLPAHAAPSACQYCEMRGLCRRDYWEHGPDA
jgi:ATP-dependent helicase/nuclease subunit B